MGILNYFVSKQIRSNGGANEKNLTKSVVSLILATIVLISATVCWFETRTSTAKTNEGIQLNADNGLRINDVEHSFESIADKSWLLPASSVDGRNIFFPADGTDFATETEKMTFRSANVGDKNYSYIHYDFYLTAEEDATNIYINTKEENGTPKSYLYFTDEADLKPSARVKSNTLRAAIYYEGIPDNQPIVLNSQNRTVSTDAVEAIDRTDGSFLSTSSQISYPFKDYSYGKKMVATMNRGETRKFSLLVWIEGTTEECTDDLMGESISLSIDFTTSWDYVSTIIFDDSGEKRPNNQPYGISALMEAHPEYTLILNYTNEALGVTGHNFTMYKYKENGVHNGKWSAKIPDSAVSDLEFRIVDTTDNNSVVVLNGREYRWSLNEFGRSTKNRGTSERYIVEGIKSFGGTNELGYGHWYDGDIEDGGNGRDEGAGETQPNSSISVIDDNDW